MAKNILISIILFLFFLFLFLTGCSSSINNINNNNTSQENLSMISNISIEKIKLTPQDIKIKELKNISKQINETLYYDNGTYGLALTVETCEGMFNSYFRKNETQFEKCKELKQKMENLRKQQSLIESNTKGIITHSSEEIKELPFTFELLNINPTMIRFNLNESKEFSLFIVDTDYECLFMNGTFKTGENIVTQTNGCEFDYNQKINILIDYNNKIKRFNVTSDSREFKNLVNKTITGVTFPDGDDSNVTWSITRTITNPSNIYTYKIFNFRNWIVYKDENFSFDSGTIAKDTVSGKLLEKKIPVITIKPKETYSYEWSFNYTDIPSPMSWNEFEYYYVIK